MVKETLKDKLNYDYHTLGYTRIAKEYLEKGGEGGVILAQKCLENILTEAGVDDPWITSTVTDPEVIKKTIEYQLETYNICKDKEKIGDLIDYFSGVFNEYSEEGASRVKKQLKDFVGMTYGELEKQIAIAQHRIKGEKLGETSKEDAEKAKKVLETYQKVFATINMAESPRLSRFKSEVEDSFNKYIFNQMYPEEQAA